MMTTDNDPKELHCWTDGTTTVSAYSAEDAVAVLYTECGEEDPAAPFALVPDDKVIRVRSDEPDGPEMVEKTAREWANEGRGPVCSTEW